MTLDPVGNISLALQIVILFLLVLGLPFFRGQKVQKEQKNLIAHGYSTVAALILHTALIFVIMVPSLASGFPEIGDLSAFDAFTVLSHAFLGTLAEILGLFIVVLWLGKGPKKMTCWKHRRWMSVTFIIWVISVVNGTLVHIFGLI
jgi:uncharacterized membrane protein YozB (DUF420 family)